MQKIITAIVTAIAMTSCTYVAGTGRNPGDVCVREVFEFDNPEHFVQLARMQAWGNQELLEQRFGKIEEDWAYAQDPKDDMHSDTIVLLKEKEVHTCKYEVVGREPDYCGGYCKQFRIKQCDRREITPIAIAEVSSMSEIAESWGPMLYETSRK
ncbi:MAG: hypothetical protein V1760_00255 [Candidatus Peregrinibacteria bacterium]